MSPITLVLFLSTGSFVSSKGFRIAATLFALEMGAGPLQVSILFALWGLFPFLLAIYAGRIADRFDNRLLMYYGLAGFTLSLSLPFIWPTMTALYVSAAAAGLTSMIFVVAAQNLVGSLGTGALRTRNFSHYSVGESMAGMAGPVLVGLWIDGFGHPMSFLFIALVNATCLVVLYFSRVALPQSTAGRTEAKSTSRSRELLKLPALRNALIANGLVMTGLDLYMLYMPVYTHSLGFNATTIGLIVGAFGLAALITRLAIPAITARWGERRMLTGAFVLSAVAFVAIPLTTMPLLLGIASLLLGLGLGCGQPLTMILSFNAAPPGRSAEAIAMRLAVSYGAHVAIPPAFGAVGAGLGISPVFWTCALLLGAGSLLTRERSKRA
jgi:predicted MFS family arabinose efflux permease